MLLNDNRGLLRIVYPPVFSLAGGNETIAAYERLYLSVCMLFSLGQMGQRVIDRFVMASGKPQLFVFTRSAASLTNLFLDPIFIFGLFWISASGNVWGRSGSCNRAVYGACLQGLFPGTKSMGLSMMRQAVFPVPLTFLFRQTGISKLIWLSFVMAKLPGIPLAPHLFKGAKKSLFLSEHTGERNDT